MRLRNYLFGQMPIMRTVAVALIIFAGAYPAFSLNCLRPLHVDGKWVKDDLGNNVSLHGVNVYMPVGDVSTPQGVIDFIDETAFGSQAYGNATVLRLCYYAYGAFVKNPFEWGYEEFIRPAVDRCKKRGLYCIVEPHHFPYKDDYARSTFGSVDAQIKWHEDFWHYMAPRLKDEPHVLFGCANESFGSCGGRIRPWMVNLVDIIRSYDTDGDNIVIVQGGGSYGNDVSCYVNNPIDKKNIMYERHKYGQHSSLDNDDGGAFVKLADNHPCLVGEWHYLRPNGNDVGTSISTWTNWYRNHPNVWSTVWRDHDKDNPDNFSSMFENLNVDLPACGPANIMSHMSVSKRTGIVPLQISLDASKSRPSDGASISSVQWEFGDGSSGSGTSTSHTWTTPGTYEVVVRVSDSKGQSESDTTRIQAFGPLPPGITRINCGGPNVADSDGNLWVADNYALDGRTGGTYGAMVDGTDDDILYYTERFKLTGYSIPVDNGKHTVRLYFSEGFTRIEKAGERVFDVSVENQQVTDFDIFKEAGGRDRSVVKEFDVDVSDGSVDIAFTKKVQNPFVNAIEVIAEGAVEISSPAPGLKIPTGATNETIRMYTVQGARIPEHVRRLPHNAARGIYIMSRDGKCTIENSAGRRVPAPK